MVMMMSLLQCMISLTRCSLCLLKGGGGGGGREKVIIILKKRKSQSFAIISSHFPLMHNIAHITIILEFEVFICLAGQQHCSSVDPHVYLSVLQVQTSLASVSSDPAVWKCRHTMPASAQRAPADTLCHQTILPTLSTHHQGQHCQVQGRHLDFHIQTFMVWHRIQGSLWERVAKIVT